MFAAGLFLISTVLIWPVSPTRHLQIPLYPAIRVSTCRSSILHHAGLSYDLTDIVFVDRQCGIRETDCPGYCNDGSFTVLYCRPTCQPITPHSRAMLCGNGHVLDTTQSESAKPLNISWTAQTTESRKLSGHRWREDISFSVLDRFLTYSILYRTRQLNIVIANSLDKRVLRDRSALLGLAPGANGAATQLYEQYRLSHNILTLAMPPLSVNHRKLGAFHLKIGDLDGSRCRKWRFVNSLSKNKWAFPIDAVDFMGVQLKIESTMGIFTHDENHIAVGKPIAQQLIDQNAMEFYDETDSYVKYKRPCQVNKDYLVWPIVKIHSGDVELRLYSRSTFTTFIDSRGSTVPPRDPPRLPHGAFECLLNVVTLKQNPHAGKNVWTFGRGFLNDHCIALDYERKRIGFADIRRKTFPS